MEIGFSLPLKLGIDDKITYVHKIESLNFDHLWIGDNSITVDVFSNVKLALSSSHSLNVWTGITSPFYYTLRDLSKTCYYLSRNFSHRFGLGLGIGRKEILPENYKKRPVYYFKKAVRSFIETYISSYNNSQLDFPLAIGALEKKMCLFAFEVADILLLNSASERDIEYAHSLRSSIANEPTTKVFSYGMLDILADSNSSISPFVWNIIKKIVTNASIQLLKRHGYSAKVIEIIKNTNAFVWDSRAPKGQWRAIIEDFAFVGTIEQIIEKLEKFKALHSTGYLEGMAFGWVYKSDQWDKIKEMRKLLK